MNETRIPLTFTPAGLDAIAMALQCLQSVTGATINDIRAQVQAMQQPPLTPNEETPEAQASGGSVGP